MSKFCKCKQAQINEGVWESSGSRLDPPPRAARSADGRHPTLPGPEGAARAARDAATAPPAHTPARVARTQ